MSVTDFAALQRSRDAAGVTRLSDAQKQIKAMAAALMRKKRGA